MNTQSDNINELAAALAKAQAEMGSVHKDAANPYFKSSYATLANVWEAVKPSLTQNGLALVQMPGSDEHGYFVQTQIMHSSGQWLRSTTRMKPAKEDPQGIGSLISYARRYALQAMVMACPDDDDGEAAMGRPQGKAPSKPSNAPTKPVETPKAPAKTDTAESKESPANEQQGGKKVNELLMALAEQEVTPQEFMSYMRHLKIIPQNANNFFAMKEKTAEKFLTNWDDTKRQIAEAKFETM